MQAFHWNLLNSQEVKTRDSHLERESNGDLVQVTETEHYINLVFTRNLDTPNLSRLKELEAEYAAITFERGPGYVAPVMVSWIGGSVLAAMLNEPLKQAGLILGFVVAGVGCVFWIKRNIRVRAEVAKANARRRHRLQEIIEECQAL